MTYSVMPSSDTPLGGNAQLSAAHVGGYDAVRDRGRRRAPTSRLQSEDRVLPDRDRRRLVATTHDVRRNFALVAWMIRRHLDYVASHRFQATTDDPGLNKELEAFVRWWSKARNFDAARRHPQRRFMRISEALKVLAGDIGHYHLRNKRIQAIEGDRIRNARQGLPSDIRIENWDHGVKINAAGEAEAYMICDRTVSGNGFRFNRVIPAKHLILHAHYDRFDQVRGVSPLAAALNTFIDVYEGFDYALARAKISQLFALAITSDAEPSGEHISGDDETGYKVDFGRGPVKLELNPGDDAKFLESNQPSSEFQAFTELCIQVALKSLDIPYSFYDESHTNFYGSRGALMQYIKSCRDKREDVQDVLDAHTDWRLRMAIEDKEITLPRGMEIDQVRRMWRWVPDGVPWWDMVKEVRGYAMAIAAGFETWESVVTLTGGGTGDARENVKRNGEFLKYCQEEAHFPVVLPGAGAFNPEPAAASGNGEEDGRD